MIRFTSITTIAMFCALLFSACGKSSKPREVRPLREVPLIPRDVLFGDPDRAAVRMSPDGEYISFLSPVDGVMNIWVGPAEEPSAAKPITFDKGRGIRSYFWSYTNQHILYLQDKDGDENWRVYSVNVGTRDVKDLTPMDEVQARIQEVSKDFPETILVGLNDRDKSYHDIYRVNILSGERELVKENQEEFRGFITDDNYEIRFASRYAEDGTVVYYQPDGQGGWKEFMVIPEEDTMNTGIAGFDKSGDILYFYDSRGRDTSALTSLNLKTGEQSLIAEDPRADISGVMSHPTEKTIEAVSFTYDRERWIFLDKTIEKDFEYLRLLQDGDITITTRTLDDSKWIVAFLRDNGPVEYYIYDRPTKSAEYLFTNRKALEGLPLAPMKPVIIESRDGMQLVSYLSLPVTAEQNANGFPKKPLPMVLLVHGGPWARDEWGYDSQHQLLANRGYAVLSVNFRGSSGFGKSFINAANKEWGAKMHDDLIDAVDWAVDNGIADRDRIAIMGGSYGGYATLAGLTFTPDVFACGVDIVGPSSLVTLLNSIPPYWKSGLQMFKTRVGDHTTEEGREFLESRSPLNYVDKIEKPLLIAQGANDPRVKQAEADQIVAAMQSRSIPVTYVLYPDEGHGFVRPQNRISFMAVTEAFLAENLGGRFEAIGEAFENSSITVPAGAQEVPALQEALPAQDAAK